MCQNLRWRAFEIFRRYDVQFTIYIRGFWYSLIFEDRKSIMRFALLIITVLICGSVSSQDIIVRITGDTLHVKVDSQNETFVYYISQNSRRDELEVISRKEISQILYNFEKPNKDLRRKTNRKSRDYEILQITGQFVGYYLPNQDIPTGDLEEYYEDLQFGSGYKVGVSYFLSRQFGLGLTYARSKFSNSLPVTHPPTGAYGQLVDDMTLNYFGTSAELRIYFGGSETNLLLSVGAGMNFFRNDAKIIYGYELKGNGVGLQAAASFNLSLGGGLFIPISIGYIGNTVGNFSLKMDENMPAEFRESLELSYNSSNNLEVGRMYVGVGLSFAF